MSGIPISEARARIAELVDQAHEGKHIIITYRGEPWAVLSPIGSKPTKTRKPTPTKAPKSPKKGKKNTAPAESVVA